MTDIIHIVSGDLWAGAEVQVFHTMFNLQRQHDFSYAVIIFNDGILCRKLQEAGIRCMVLDESKLSGVKMLGIMTRYLHNLRPGVVHVHAYKEHIFGKLACLLSRSRATIVRTFHGMSGPSKELSFFKRLNSNVIHKIEKFFMKNCNIIAVSKDLEGFLSLSFPNASVTQIYNGMPVPEMDSSGIVRVRKKYGIDARTFWIGSVARLEKIKNLEMLIDVGNELKDKGISFKISIFGAGSQKEYLQNRIALNGLQNLVKLEGFEKNILQIIKALDVFTLCSFHEGMPMSLLEAMALETAVICTAVGGMKEIIENNHSGLLVPSSDACALASGFKRLLHEKGLKERLAHNGRMTIMQRFNINNTNQKLVELYQTILKHRAAVLN